jgi:hypothetical protein
MLMNKFTLTKKRTLISTIVICIVAISGVTLWLNTRTVAQAAVINPHPGLIGWWAFNEGTGTIAGDSSGNGNNGTIYGATWVAGKSQSYALSFSGSHSSYVNVPSLPALNQLSVECWAKISGVIAPPYDWQPIIHGANPAASPLSSYEIFFNPAINYLLASLGGTSNPILQVPSTLQSGVWYFVTLTYNGSSAEIYVNDVLAGSWSTTGSVTGQNGLTVATDGVYSLSGTVDEVRIFNRALSTSEIQADFQQGPNLSVNVLANVPKGTTQVITTLSWQGTGSINVTIVSPSQTYNESTVLVYQKTDFSTSNGLTTMLNIKRLSVSVNALTSAQSWYIELTMSNVNAYQISVEVQS